MSSAFEFKIVEEIATLATHGAWTLELNRVSWGGRPATYDLRRWAPDHEKAGKGLTLSEDELHALVEAVA